MVMTRKILKMRFVIVKWLLSISSQAESFVNRNLDQIQRSVRRSMAARRPKMRMTKTKMRTLSRRRGSDLRLHPSLRRHPRRFPKQ
jgi:hypothetical protein